MEYDVKEYDVVRIHAGNTQLATWLERGESVVIKRRANAVAVAVPVEDYWRMKQALDVLNGEVAEGEKANG